MKAATTLLMACLLSSSLSAQPPNPTCEPGSVAMRQLCAETLPASGYIYTSYSKGGGQRCPCQGLLGATVAELDSLRNARDLLYQTRAMNRQAPVTETPGSYTYMIMASFEGLEEGALLREDTSVYLDHEPQCERESRLEEIAHTIANLEGIGVGLTNRFQLTVVYDELAANIRFMSIAAQGETGWFKIVIPAPLLCADVITDEVLVFMILHEMGHVFGDEGDEPTLLASEFAADHWATAVGIPAYYGDAAAPYVRNLVAEGYEAYHTLIYTEATAERSTCDHRGVNNYPRLNCRTRGITDPLWSNTSGGLQEEFPDPCWEVCATGERRMVLNTTHTWDRTTCCPAKPTELVCILPPAICYEVKRLIDLQQHFVYEVGVKVPTVCELHPELCRLEDRRPSFEDLIERPDIRQKRIVKQMQKATDGLRDIEEELLNDR